MPRRAVLRIILALLLVATFTIAWALAYELVCSLRFKPGMAGEGARRWDLMLMQSADRSWRSIAIPFLHFWERINYPGTRTETLLRGGIAFVVTLGTACALWLAERLNRKPTHYGAAKFGNILDAERAGLTSKAGLILGKLGNTVLKSDDPAHVLVVGPTRSGKGVSFVIPNGMSWKGSSIWFDPKGENYAAFGRQRLAMGDQVFVFSPGNSFTHCYNPLDFIRRDERMPTDCLVVASFLIPDDGKEIWGRSARILLQAMIGYAVTSPATEGERTLHAAAQLTKTGKDFKQVLKSLVDLQGKFLPQWIIGSFNQFIALEDETRNSALFNVTTALGPWNSELIIAATSRTDFDIRKLRREAMAIFISASVAELEIFRPIVKLLIQQVHDQLMQNLPGKDEPLKVLIMIDEFRQLGRMDDLVSKLTINAGYGFRMCLILQDLGQLDELYGRPTRITTVSACQVKLFIRINDVETSEYVSEMLGSKTEELVTPLIRGNQRVFQRRDKNVQYIEMPLRSPQELREMPETAAVLLVPNSPGFILRKIRFFADNPWKTIERTIQNRPVVLPRLKLESDLRPPLAPDPILDVNDRVAVATELQAPAESTPIALNRKAKIMPTQKSSAKKAGPQENLDNMNIRPIVTAAIESSVQDMQSLLNTAATDDDKAKIEDLMKTFEAEAQALAAAESD